MQAPIENRPPLVHSVLHATDFSPASERAFANALAIALLRQTRLTLLHVHGRHAEVDWQKFPPVRSTLERWGLLERGSRQADVRAKLQVEVAKVDIEGLFPAAAVVQYLATNPHDLLVLATEGEAGLPTWFSRSTSETIAAGAQVPTLFVPATARRGLVSLASGDYSLRSILVPVAQQPSADRAVEFAIRTANILADEPVAITRLHVGEEMSWPATDDGAKWHFNTERRTGSVVEEILVTAETLPADLIIMSTAADKSFVDVLEGSTTQQVLRKAHCPVLAIPARA